MKLPTWEVALRTFCALTLLVSGLGIGHAQTQAQLELFEKNARPLFAEKCQGCHNEKLKSGGIDFSSPNGIKEAGATGIFGNAAEPEKSVILKALSYEGQIKMPPQGKLPVESIAALREWVAAGAPAPAITPSAGDSLAGTGVRPAALRCRIARHHPGASPAAFVPARAWEALRALAGIAVGRDPRPIMKPSAQPT